MSLVASPEKKIQPSKRITPTKKSSSLNKRQKISDGSELKTFNFSYIPDPSLYQGGTWREEEVLGHNSLAYPVAELIDNSLTATKNNAKRRITISVIRRKGGEVLCVVRDNGTGMDVEGLQNLAVFAHAPQFRNGTVGDVLDTKNSKSVRYINSCISRFGVGLKNAAFHLGDDLIIITKTKGENSVMEFKMNISEMRAKYAERRDKAYEGTVFQRLPGAVEDSMVDTSKPSPALENLIRSETKHSHFTAVVISGIDPGLYPSLVDVDRRENFARNLASLYHYYLNGVYGKSVPIKKQKKRLKEKLVTAEIVLEFHDEAKAVPVDKVELNKIEDDIQSLNHKFCKGIPFEFELILPNKDAVVGVLFYYPFVNDQETIPSLDEYKKNTIRENITNGDPDKTRQNRNFKRDQSNNSIEPIFDCFWQGRQIPFTKVSILNFMKNIEDHLSRRIRGALFFNESFAVNPQKNIFNEDLNQILNNQNAQIVNISDDCNANDSKLWSKRNSARTPKEKHMTDPAKRVERWAKKMSSRYDKEIRYKDEDETKTQNNGKFYNKAIYVNKEFNRGDLVKIHSGDNIYHFGKITHFLVEKNKDGRVKYNRLPLKMFGTEEYSKPTRDLIKEFNREDIKNEYKAEKQKLLENFPDTLVFDFDTNLYNDLEFPPRENVTTGYIFPDVYIKILGKKNGENHKNSIIVTKLADKRTTGLVVRQILQHLDFKKNSWVDDKKINGVGVYCCNPLSVKYRDKGTYYFEPTKITQHGKSRMVFATTLKNKTEWLVHKTFDLNVIVGIPTELKLPKKITNITIGKINQFSDHQLQMELTDEAENPVMYDPNMRILAKFYQFKRDKENNIIKGQEENYEVNAFVSYNQKSNMYCLCNFRAIPKLKEEIPLTGKMHKMILELKINDSAAILKQKINFLLFPGVPKTINILPKNLTAINGGDICKALISLYDEYGNLTGSTHQIDNLVFNVLKQKHVSVANDCVCLRVESKKEYVLPNINVRINWSKFSALVRQTKPKMPKFFNLPCEVYATNNSKKNENIDPLKITLRVDNDPKVYKIGLCRNPAESVAEEEVPMEKEFKIELGKINRIFIVFFDETGQVVKNVDESGIKHFRAEIFNDSSHEIKKDKNKNWMIEIQVPEKMSGVRNCFLEFQMKDESIKKLTKKFKIIPIFGDPVMWELEFVDNIMCGSKLGDKLTAWLADKFGNRIDANEFEDPVATNPTIIASCEFKHMTPRIDTQRGCFVFPDGLVQGEIGEQTIEIAANAEYDFSASKKVAFNVQCGFPEKISAEVYKEGGIYSAMGSLNVFSRDVISFKASLVDLFGNLVTSGNYSVVVSIKHGVIEPTSKTLQFRQGKCKDRLFIKAKSDFTTNLKITFSVPEIENIKPAAKFLTLVANPQRVSSIEISPISSFTAHLRDAAPVIRFAPKMEVPSEKYAGEAKNFSLDEQNRERRLYGEAVRVGDFFEFRSERGFEEIGSFEFWVVYSECKSALPDTVRSEKIVLVVVPGDPTSLFVKNGEELKLLSGDSQFNCLVAEKIELGVCDKSGSKIQIETIQNFPPISVILRSKTNQSSLPKLTYYQKKNCILNLSIKENSGDFEGKCVIEFSVDAEWKEGNKHIALMRLNRACLPFFLSKNTKRIEKQKTLQTSAQTITAKMASVRQKMDAGAALGAETAQIERKMAEIAKKTPKLCSMPQGLAQKSLCAELARLKTEIAQKAHEPSLPPFSDPLTELDGYIGRVGELITVDSESVARCVMHLLGTKLNLHLTATADCAASKRCVEHLKQHRPLAFLNIDLLPQRSFRELAARPLPHEGRFSFDRERQPERLVRRLRLRRGQRAGAATFERVLCFLLWDALLMERLEDAIEYESRCVAARAKCGRIVTADGFHVQMVKQEMPPFEAMRRKRRGVEVAAAGLERKLAWYEEIEPEIKSYFELKKRLDQLTAEIAEYKEKLPLQQKEMEALKRRRMAVSEEMKKVVAEYGNQ